MGWRKLSPSTKKSSSRCTRNSSQKTSAPLETTWIVNHHFPGAAYRASMLRLTRWTSSRLHGMTRIAGLTESRPFLASGGDRTVRQHRDRRRFLKETTALTAIAAGVPEPAMAEDDKIAFICVTCGTQYRPSAAPRPN